MVRLAVGINILLHNINNNVHLVFTVLVHNNCTLLVIFLVQYVHFLVIFLVQYQFLDMCHKAICSISDGSYITTHISTLNVLIVLSAYMNQ